MAKRNAPAPVDARPPEPDEDAPESEQLSLLETQKLLEARDKTPPPLPPELRAAAEIEKEVGAMHALDLAPIHSKIVVCEGDAPVGGAFLADTVRVYRLPNDDPAQKLPRDARIRKDAEDKYVATQLNPAEKRPDLVTKTAAEALAKFVKHFHGPVTE